MNLRKHRFHQAALMFIMVAAFTLLWLAAQREHHGKAVAGDNTEVALVPVEHHELRSRLGRDTKLDFNEAPLREVLRSLSQTLGAPIYLDPQCVKQGKFSVDFGRQPIDAASDPLDARITLKSEQPVAIEWALRELLNWLGQADYTFDQGICLIARGAATNDRYVIRTYELTAYSDYSTAKRLRLIEQFKTDISPDAWSRNRKAWTLPSRNVFSIDICQTRDVHDQIALHLREKWNDERFVPYEEISELQNQIFGFGEKNAIVKLESIVELVEKLRHKYKYESLVKRLEYESRPMSRNMSDPELSQPAEQRLQGREQQFVPPTLGREKTGVAWVQIRSESLRQLHEEEVVKFISRDGFGFSRMPTPGPSQLPQPRTVPLPLVSAEVKGWQGVPLRLPKDLSEKAAIGIALPTEDALAKFHQYGEDDFIAPQSFGYVKDREHVAGFSSHAFDSLPRLHLIENEGRHTFPTEHWAVHKLELVSLLKFDKPAVYLSSNLPRMEDLDDTSTRPLDDFEASALQRLYKGEDVVTRAATNHIEMIGSLRATKQCTQCHDVRRGQLLGAFTYDLFRDPAIQPE